MIYVGTSGWVYQDWLGKFYPEDLTQRRWLAYYAEDFKTVEINSTFYHAAKPKTYQTWAESVSDGFIFALKSSRFITHLKKLKVPKDSIRFHGQGGSYASKYRDSQLRVWAGKIKKWHKSADVYAYFNNDINAYAVLNAKTMGQMVQ